MQLTVFKMDKLHYHELCIKDSSASGLSSYALAKAASEAS